MPSYHNTIHETGRALAKREKKAKSQDRLVYDLFRKMGRAMSASEIYRLWPEHKTPLTSVRRSITNLKNAAMLVKTSEKVMGLYGSPEYKYQLPDSQLSLF